MRSPHQITRKVPLEAAIHEDPSSSAYITRSWTFPFNSSTAAAVNWIRTYTNIWAARENSGVNQSGATIETVGLYDASAILGYGAVKGTGYDSLTSQEKRSRVEQAARVLVTRASNGVYLQTYFHNGEITAEEFGWFLDEVMKYASLYNVTVASMADVASEVMTSGEWTDAEGDDIWTRSFTDTADYRPYYRSSLIDAGGSVVGRLTDYLGLNVYGAPDIGAYEYQPPYTIGSHLVDTTASIRIYSDGKYRYTTATSSTPSANLNVRPVGDFPEGDYSEFLNLTIDSWLTTGTKNKQWTASSTTATSTVYTIGDLASNRYYQFKLDGVAAPDTITGDTCTNGLCLTDSSGSLTFTYSGGYSTHAFALEQNTDAPTGAEIASVTPDSPTQLTVTAANASDADPGLHSAPYWFSESSGNPGGSSSDDWQTPTVFVDSGLSANTQYTSLGSG